MNSTLESELARQVPALGAVLAGKYRVDALLGQGGMGVVYRATNLVTEKTVAIKWLLPGASDDHNARERFVREARAAARIPHPNVVDVYDVVEHDASMFLVMEYLVGEPLSARLARGGLAIPELIRLLLPAMRAVSAAHARGVIHRDLKPENLFLCKQADGNESLKVLDFGISKIVNARDYEHSLTRSGSAVGTPRYMPVEQLSGEKDVDQRVDVYAFGVILYQALTGQVPFDGDSYGAIAIRVATHTPELPRKLRPDIPPLLERAVLGAMARDKNARFATMDALVRALESALFAVVDVDGTVSATRPALPAAAPQPAAVLAPRETNEPQKRLPWAAAVLVIAGVALWLWLRSVSQQAGSPVEVVPDQLAAPAPGDPPSAPHDVPPSAPSGLDTSAPAPPHEKRGVGAEASALPSPVEAVPPATPPASSDKPARPRPKPRPAVDMQAADPPPQQAQRAAVESPSGRGSGVQEPAAPRSAEEDRTSVRHRAGELEKTQF